MKVLVLNGPNLAPARPAAAGDLRHHDATPSSPTCASTGAPRWASTSRCGRPTTRASCSTGSTRPPTRSRPVVLNAAAWTHYSYAIFDACAQLTAPLVEVHISAPEKRPEEFRHTSRGHAARRPGDRRAGHRGLPAWRWSSSRNESSSRAAGGRRAGRGVQRRPRATAPAARCRAGDRRGADRSVWRDRDARDRKPSGSTPRPGSSCTTVAAGSGETAVVLVHGSGTVGVCAWAADIGWLADAGLRVVGYDAACVGNSTCEADEPAPVEDLASVVASVRDDGAERVVVLAASAGGPMAPQIAADPDGGVDAGSCPVARRAGPRGSRLRAEHRRRGCCGDGSGAVRARRG